MESPVRLFITIKILCILTLLVRYSYSILVFNKYVLYSMCLCAMYNYVPDRIKSTEKLNPAISQRVSHPDCFSLTSS